MELRLGRITRILVMIGLLTMLSLPVHTVAQNDYEIYTVEIMDARWEDREDHAVIEIRAVATASFYQDIYDISIGEVNSEFLGNVSTTQVTSGETLVNWYFTADTFAAGSYNFTISYGGPCGTDKLLPFQANFGESDSVTLPEEEFVPIDVTVSCAPQASDEMSSSTTIPSTTTTVDGDSAHDGEENSPTNSSSSDLSSSTLNGSSSTEGSSQGGSSSEVNLQVLPLFTLLSMLVVPMMLRRGRKY